MSSIVVLEKGGEAGGGEGEGGGGEDCEGERERFDKDLYEAETLHVLRRIVEWARASPTGQARVNAPGARGQVG